MSLSALVENSWSFSGAKALLCLIAFASYIDTFCFPATNMATPSWLHMTKNDDGDDETTVRISHVRPRNMSLTNQQAAFEHVRVTISGAICADDYEWSNKVLRCYCQFDYILQYIEPKSWVIDAAKFWREREEFKKDNSKLGNLFQNYQPNGKKMPWKRPTLFYKWKCPNVYTVRRSQLVNLFRQSLLRVLCRNTIIADVLLGHLLVLLGEEPELSTGVDSQESSVSSREIRLRERKLLQDAGLSQEEIRFFVQNFLYGNADEIGPRPAVILGKVISHSAQEGTQEDGA
jgi:hypothetical protein